MEVLDLLDELKLLLLVVLVVVVLLEARLFAIAHVVARGLSWGIGHIGVRVVNAVATVLASDSTILFLRLIIRRRS